MDYEILEMKSAAEKNVLYELLGSYLRKAIPGSEINLGCSSIYVKKNNDLLCVINIMSKKMMCMDNCDSPYLNNVADTLNLKRILIDHKRSSLDSFV